MLHKQIHREECLSYSSLVDITGFEGPAQCNILFPLVFISMRYYQLNYLSIEDIDLTYSLAAMIYNVYSN